MKKKGFTLIELLAVIVILAIIALIATPIVMNVIENAKKGAAERSAENYLSAVETAIMEEKLNNKEFNPDLCIIENNNKLSCDEGKITIDIKGKEISSGYVRIENGKIVDYSITIDEEDIESTESTPVDCFVYLDNHEYTVNQTTCNSYFEDVVDADGASILCSGEAGDLISMSEMMLGVSADELVESGVIGDDWKEIGTTSIVGYNCGGENGTHKNVIIPKKINGKLVTGILASTFNAAQITSVVIPNSITTIGNGVFYDNELESIIIPNSVTTIGEEAFSYNQITSVVIPNSVTSIGEYAFFSNKIENVVIPNSVTSIGEYAFASNKIENVVIPNSITTIGEYAFYRNSLKKVKINNAKENVTLGNKAFGNFDVNNIEWANN